MSEQQTTPGLEPKPPEPAEPSALRPGPCPRALRLALIYAGVGAAWIFGSDRLLLAATPDMAMLSALGQGKGIAFVLASALLVYFSAAATQRNEAAELVATAPTRGPTANAVPWVFASLAATLVLAGLLGLAHTGRMLRDERLERLHDLAALRAERIADWHADAAMKELPLLPDMAIPGQAAAALERLMRAPTGGTPAQLMLLAHDGRDGRDVRLWTPQGRPGVSIADFASLDAAGGHARIANMRDAAGRPLLAAAAPVRGTPWFVVAAIQRGAALDGLASDAVTLALINGLALAGAAIVLLARQRQRERAVSMRQRADEAEKRHIWQLLEAIADSSSDAIYAKDPDGRYLFANREACRVTGRTLEQLLGRDTSAAFPAEQARRLTEADRAALESPQPIHTEATLTTSEGERTFLTTKGRLVDPAGQVLGMFGISRDITERRRQEQQQRLWAMAFASTQDGVMIANAAGRIEAINAAFAAITGYSSEEAVGQTPRLLQSGRHDPAFYDQMWRALREEGHWRGEIWNRRRSGEIYPEWLTVSAVRDAAGTPTHYVGVFTDISRVKQHEAQLEQLAHYDPLTGLPNRRMLQERLEQILAHASRRGDGEAGGRTALLFIDLDGFKTVNDSLGHPAGDEVLVCMAKRLKARLRQDDLLGRLGGDEFLVVVEGLDEPDDMAVLARDLLIALAEPVPLACGSDAYVTASIGISIHPDDGSESAVELLRDADAAMYRAKDLGRNRFCFYTSDMNADAVARLELEAALSRALERDELRQHYQPKVDAVSGRIVGAETLLRWERGGIGLVPPGDFIPIAEQSSLILAIGGWVIDTTCRQIRAWLDAGQPVVPIAVNVTARQFASGDLPEIVAAALARHDVPSRYLEIELTEGMLMTDPVAATALLQRIRSLGVKLSLDDFGTGYSSLAYLQQFPLDALKIDQSFVRRIGMQPDGAAIVDAVIALAHRLGLGVVAEGVETQAQRDYLASRGCDEMQGYHFARPETAAALQERLAAQG